MTALVGSNFCITPCSPASIVVARGPARPVLMNRPAESTLVVLVHKQKRSGDGR